MIKGLTVRRQEILNIIINEYVSRMSPVASEVIYRNYQLGISPATIRHDMAQLEDEGYITRPHTSAGSIPSDKAYRYHVESLAEDIELPLDEQYLINNTFHEAGREFERWLKLAATLLSRLVRNAALVTLPEVKQQQFKRLELVSLHDFLALLVVVLNQTIVKRQFLAFNEPVTQEQLTSIANKLNVTYSGLTSPDISAKKLGGDSKEELVTQAVMEIMTSRKEADYDEPYLAGLRLMLDQPEFIHKARMLNIMELMETKEWLKIVFSRRSGRGRVQVIIGEESKEEVLQDLSFVIGHYGIPNGSAGTIGVIGPTRMDYGRAISIVSYMSEVLSNLVAEVHQD